MDARHQCILVTKAYPMGTSYASSSALPIAAALATPRPSYASSSALPIVAVLTGHPQLPIPR